VIRDITEITHPKTLTPTDISSPTARFVSASEVSYWTNPGLVRMQIASLSKTLVVACAGVFDWSPDGTAVVYLKQSDSGIDLHQLRGGQDRVLGSMPGKPATGCASQSCVDSLDLRLFYSPDGAFISLVENWGGPSFRLWKSDGTLLKSLDSASLGGAEPPTMSAWSGHSLYFRDAGGVEVWRDGAVSSFLPGVAWIHPKGSPGGGQIVYAVRGGDGLAHTFVVDAISAKVHELGKGRAEPIFLSPSLIWYQEERLCAPSDQCQVTSTAPTGTTYIYDLQDGTESESRITAVYDVWPHPA
jgi:hypothetical protein